MNYLIDRKEINPWIFPGIKPNILFKSSDQIMGEISLVVCEYFNISLEQLRGKRTSQYFCDARKIAIYFCCETKLFALREIGRYFNDRHHTSVLYERDQVKDRMEIYPHVKNTVKTIEQLLDKV